MEKYRNSVRTGIIISSIGAAVLAAIQILAYARVLRPIAADSHWADMWNGFIAGAALGVMILFIIGIIRSAMALRSEKALKKMYIKDNDEREQRICTSARSMGATIFLVGGIVAGIFAGYFSVSVSVTIIACVFIHSLLCGALKLYYGKKY